MHHSGGNDDISGNVKHDRHYCRQTPCHIETTMCDVYADRTNAHGTEESFVLRLYILCSASCKMHLAVGSLPALLSKKLYGHEHQQELGSGEDLEYPTNGC